jgi:hypothetical protein
VVSEIIGILAIPICWGLALGAALYAAGVFDRWRRPREDGEDKGRGDRKRR